MTHRMADYKALERSGAEVRKQGDGGGGGACASSGLLSLCAKCCMCVGSYVFIYFFILPVRLDMRYGLSNLCTVL